MAESITRRTLAGYSGARTNIVYIHDLVAKLQWKNGYKNYDLKKELYQKFNINNLDMKFSAVVGNPPYQETTSWYNRQDPIYHHFYDAAEKIGKKYCLITPARFLFNAGLTPKEWNIKMLKSNHIRVNYYNANSAELFPNTDIKGGVAIVYYNENETFNAIGKFIPDLNLQNLATHFKQDIDSNLPSIMYGGRSDLKFNDIFLDNFPNSKKERLLKIQEKHPEVTELGPNEEYELKSSTFEALSNVFEENEPTDIDKYYKILWLYKTKRVWRWVRRDFMVTRYPKRNNIKWWKVFIPKANGSGWYWETLSLPTIWEPYTSATPTFISIGNFDTKIESINLSKYIKTKFLRSLLGILKITQDNPPSMWSYIPLQDFTNKSDIDWTQSVVDIDKQLYAKYGLDQSEIDFIESHVKPMV